MIYKHNDSTSQGYLYASMSAYLRWASEWKYENDKLMCIKFIQNASTNVLEILKDKKRLDYRSCIMAYNRHRAEIEKKIGIYKLKKVKPVEMVKVLYYNGWDGIKSATIKKGAKSINEHKKPEKVLWTEEKQKWTDEYNKNEVEHRKRQSELQTKIFKDSF